MPTFSPVPQVPNKIGQASMWMKRKLTGVALPPLITGRRVAAAICAAATDALCQPLTDTLPGGHSQEDHSVAKQEGNKRLHGEQAQK